MATFSSQQKRKKETEAREEITFGCSLLVLWAFQVSLLLLLLLLCTFYWLFSHTKVISVFSLLTAFFNLKLFTHLTISCSRILLLLLSFSPSCHTMYAAAAAGGAAGTALGAEKREKAEETDRPFGFRCRCCFCCCCCCCGPSKCNQGRNDRSRSPRGQASAKT